MRFLRKRIGDHRTSLFPLYKVGMFWDELKVVLSSLNMVVSLDIKDVLFGILDTDNLSILVNYILLESKYFINLPLYVK